MLYRRRPTPLHTARASTGAAWCGSLLLAILFARGPLTLALLGLAVFGAAALAHTLRPVVRAALLMLPIALLFALISALVARQGLTVIARIGDLGPFGQGDITLEAVVYGLLFASRLVLLTAASVLLAACIDPDALLRAAGRRSLRSALGATLALRLVPALAADARRFDEARRLRPVPARGGRVAVLRAVTGGALDRALDVATTLELRGFGGEAARRWRPAEPRSRQDLAFAASALALVALTALSRATGLGAFTAYPQLSGAVAGQLVIGTSVALAALAPFAVRRGVGR